MDQIILSFLFIHFLDTKSDESICSKQFSNMDIFENNLYHAPGEQTACCDYCTKSKGCQAYAWTFYIGSVCYLRSSTSTNTTSLKQMLTGVLNTDDTCSTKIGPDLSGEIIAYRVGEAYECCDFCKETKNCKGYTWEQHDGGMCWLKTVDGPINEKAGVKIGINSLAKRDIKIANTMGSGVEVTAACILDNNGTLPSETIGPKILQDREHYWFSFELKDEGPIKCWMNSTLADSGYPTPKNSEWIALTKDENFAVYFLRGEGLYRSNNYEDKNIWYYYKYKQLWPEGKKNSTSLEVDLTGQIPTKAITTCPIRWSYFEPTNKCFYVGTENRNWYEAKNLCESKQGILATITSNKENQFIGQLVINAIKPSNEWYAIKKNHTRTIWFGMHHQNAKPRFIDTWKVSYVGDLMQPSFLEKGTCFLMAITSNKSLNDAIGWATAPCNGRMFLDGFVCSISLKNLIDNTESNYSKIWILIVALIIIIFSSICIMKIAKKYYKNRPREVHAMNDMANQSLIPKVEPNMSKLRLIKVTELIIDDSKKLGDGEFGIVYAAKFVVNPNNSKKIPVAVKVIKMKKDMPSNIEREMLEEASIMAQLNNIHLLKLIGISLADNIKIITPLRPLGSLQNFLKTKKEFLGPPELVLYCYQISWGMEYLAKNNIVHRDLATRNVLMKNNYHIEVSDFGLSAIFADESRDVGKIPFRWVPIECLINDDPTIYGEKTDVWSFGVTCWEILTFAKIPYSNLKMDPVDPLKTMYEFLSEGSRLERPKNCGLELYKTLVICWTANPSSRPTFSELKSTFEKYYKNPYAFVVCDKLDKEKHLQKYDALADQTRLIEEILGTDDYLYSNYIDIDSKTGDVDLKVIDDDNYYGMPKSLHNYYTDEKYYRRRSSDSKLCITKNSYSTPKSSIENNLYCSNSYFEIYEK